MSITNELEGKKVVCGRPYTIQGIDHFTDELIVDVIDGRRILSEAERKFLITDTPHFEECDKDLAQELPGMKDKDLIRAAYNVWADYASRQI